MSAARLHGIERFVVVRSASTEDAAVRLQSEPILHGLIGDGADAVLHVPDPAVPLTLDRPTCLIFHYADEAAANAIRHRTDSKSFAIVVCLACDIYSFKTYIDLHAMTDFFIAPTEIHRKILSSQLYKRVYTLPECVDPVVLGDGPGVRRGERRRRLLWFGYSESFMKSMASLMPILDEHRRLGSIESFTLIVDVAGMIRKFGNQPGLDLIDYNSEEFKTRVLEFDYVILSHFALDLAMNSYVKSPNKLVTSLISGLIPLCSDTPNYRALLDDYGLDRFLFASPKQLDDLLGRLDPAADGAEILRSNAAELLKERYSQSRIHKEFVAILAGHLSSGRSFSETLQPQPLPAEQPRLLRLKEHLQDLLPSAVRSVRERF